MSSQVSSISKPTSHCASLHRNVQPSSKLYMSSLIDMDSVCKEEGGSGTSAISKILGANPKHDSDHLDSVIATLE